MTRPLIGSDDALGLSGGLDDLVAASLSTARDLKLDQVLTNAVHRVVLWSRLSRRTRAKAWAIVRSAGISLRPEQEEDLRELCLKWLDNLRQELELTQLNEGIRRLNDERERILELLAHPEHLDIVLRERFALGVEAAGARILDRALESQGRPPSSHEDMWRVLQESHTAEAEASWLAALREGPLPVARAAAHRLSAGWRHLKAADLAELLTESFPLDRLSLLAAILRASRDPVLFDPFEGFLKAILPRIGPYAEYEGFASLALTFRDLAGQRGHRLLALAGSKLFTERSVGHAQYPMRCIHNPVHLRDDDYQHMFHAGGGEARAAVYRLQADAPELLAGERQEPRGFTPATIEGFMRFLTSETEPRWKGFSARAACTLGATSALTHLVELAKDPALATREITYYLPSLGVVQERHQANILRAIGYLTRLAMDRGLEDQVGKALSYLRRRFESVPVAEDRRILHGITTALCFAGEWEPLLERVEAGDQLILEAVPELLDTWIPQPPEGIVPRHRALTWLARRLDQAPDLSPDVASAFMGAKERLEKTLGIVLLLDGDRNPVISAAEVARIAISQDNSRTEQGFRERIAERPQDASALAEYALFLKNRRKDYPQAEAMYRKALELDANDSQMLANFAFFLGSVLKLDDEAEEAYLRARSLRPGDGTLIGNYASFLEHNRRNPVLAERYYRVALVRAPDDPNLHANFASLLIAAAKYPEAREQLRVAWRSCRWRSASRLVGSHSPRTLGKIFFLSSVLAELTEGQADAILRRLKSILESAFVTHPWPLEALLDAIQRRMEAGRFGLYNALSDVLSDEGKLDEMAAFPAWVALQPISWKSACPGMD